MSTTRADLHHKLYRLGHRARRTCAAMFALAVLSAGLGTATPSAAEEPAPDEPFEITEAPDLRWGFKASWRIYNAPPEVTGGAALTDGSGGAPYDLTWAFDSGTYDPVTGTTVLNYTGTAHWLKYPLEDLPSFAPDGYDGPWDIHILDVTMSDPTITIRRDASHITVEAQSRQLDTLEILDTGRIDVVSLDVSEATPTVADETTTWAGIPATTTESANAVFANNYQVGINVDAVGLSYTGPGGAPDLSELWDPPGSARLEQAGNTIVTECGSFGACEPNEEFEIWWVDAQRLMVHYETTAGYQAFDLETLEPVGDPWQPADGEQPRPVRFADGTGRAFYRRAGGDTANYSWVRFDPATETYQQVDVPGDIPIVGNANNVFWDSVGERAWNVTRVVPDGVADDDYDNHRWELHTYTEQPDGTWVGKAYTLPNLPDGLNRHGYDGETGIAALDGSLILLAERQTSTDPEVEPPSTVPGVWRITLDGESAHVETIPGAEVPNDPAGVWADVHRGPDGQLTLVSPGFGRLQNLYVTAAGVASADPVVELDIAGLDAYFTESVAVDPTDGMVWLSGWQSQRFWGVKDGRVIADQLFVEKHPRARMTVVGPDHAVYTMTNDGSPAGFGGSPIYGFGRFDRLGFSPTIEEHPSPATTTLDHVDETQEVTFIASATGDPSPAVQWQVKPAGASTFDDIDGAVESSLQVATSASHHGSQYRAVFSNPAGAIATEPAMSTVEYAPVVRFDPVSIEVVEGDDAVLQVEPSGNPQPEVRWQRLLAGFWIDLSVGSSDYTGETTPTLTVLDARLEQSGTRFRAKVANDVGTVYSKPATLTVTDAGGELGEGEQAITVVVPELGPGELAWSIDGSDHTVALGDATDAGDHWASAGEIVPVVVSDTREGGPVWSISGQVSDFTGGVSGSYLGWLPQVIEPGGGATPGSSVESGFVSGDGLSVPSVLASASEGHDRGSATVGADLDLRVPIDTDPGTYTATLTITALS